MEHWRITLWENDDGVCWVDRDLLKKMRVKEKFIFSPKDVKMNQYTTNLIENVRHQHELEKVKSEENMWELKFHLLKTEIRFLGCLAKEGGIVIFYALHAFKKKDQKIMNKHRETARARVGEFISQYNQENGPQRIL